ncbi:hypothetical protein HNP36_001769 [Chryseobacterium shigense]|uniref:Uncharacterized protein n=1 Tax=Chryseobacterium shigense TaxID=297244 RepID=A0A841N0M6_9FLAO|nr:hypothetical protein [Chryseobacterium shigense]
MGIEKVFTFKSDIIDKEMEKRKDQEKTKPKIFNTELT